MGATTVTGTILGVDNAPQVGVYVTFRLKSVGTDSAATSTIDQDAISVITDTNGQFSQTLWDNGDSGVTSVMEIRMPSGQRIDVIIPAADATIDIWDLIENQQVGGADPQLPTNEALFMRKANNLSDLASASTSRTNLGVAIGSNVQAYNANLTGVDQGLATTDDVNFAQVQIGTSTGDLLETSGSGIVGIRAAGGRKLTVNSSGVEVTAGALTLNTDLAVTEGGTGASTEAAARTNLGVVIGTDVQAYDAILQATTASFLAADETKLDGIEALAEVNDVTTVLDADIGVTVQAYDAGLQSISGLTTVADKGVYTTASDTYATYDLSSRSRGRAKQGDITTVTATTYTALDTDFLVQADTDTAAANITVTLPPAATVGAGWELTLKKLGTGGNLIVDGNAAETIEGVATQTITDTNRTITVASDGTNFMIISPHQSSGWGQYADGQYYVSSVLAVNNAKVQLTIKPDFAGARGSKIETYLPTGVTELWDDATSAIMGQKVGDSYTIRVNFIGDPGGVSDFGELVFDIGTGGVPNEITRRTISFAKATATNVSTTTEVFSLATFLANGCKIYFDTSTSGDSIDIYDITIVITRTHSAL